MVNKIFHNILCEVFFSYNVTMLFMIHGPSLMHVSHHQCPHFSSWPPLLPSPLPAAMADIFLLSVFLCLSIPFFQYNMQTTMFNRGMRSKEDVSGNVNFHPEVSVRHQKCSQMGEDPNIPHSPPFLDTGQ